MLYSPQEPTDINMMPSIGNGYLATVISSDTIYVSGLFNGLNTVDPSHRAVIPATQSFTLTNSITTATALDLRRGTYFRRGTIGKASFEQRSYAHRVHSSLLVHEISVDNSLNPNHLTFVLTINTKPETPDFKITPLNGTNDYTLYNGRITTPEEPGGPTVGITVVSTRVAHSYTVGANSASTFYFVTAIRSSLDSSDTQKDATADFLSASAQVTTLFSTHVAAWEEIWSARIEVEGDHRLAQVINSSLYYILNSVRSDWAWSLSPGSLSSNGYNGHVFWDCETWMYPPILLLHPDIAASLLQYRFDNMVGASLKARSYNLGYQGLMYPWESAFSGQEVCPDWAPTGKLEQHISGDISFAYRQYWHLTGDYNWLKTVYPVIQGIADFFASRVTYNSQFDYYEINGVIPPDEYAVDVNNSVFTNVVAGISLEFAVEAAQVLNLPYPPNWQTISSKLKIPMDTVNNVHLEYDHYNGQLIKQADVILLGYPLLYPMSAELRKNDLLYYQQRTDPDGPAMTFAMETVAFLELGNNAAADTVWFKSWVNAHDPYMVWTETPTAGTVNFITGAGGFLQAMLNGYGGIRIMQNDLQFNPQLPYNVTHVKFSKIVYLGNEVEVDYDANEVTVTLTSAGVPLTFTSPAHPDTPLTLDTPIIFPRAPFQLTKTK
uniref:Protein-glucosylgalactosylhydroxylysine glucosidase n=1 Tax=Arcella intermedia TaxID=1963864 RepID=A0A6B2KZB4_9EUKA